MYIDVTFTCLMKQLVFQECNVHIGNMPPPQQQQWRAAAVVGPARPGWAQLTWTEHKQIRSNEKNEQTEATSWVTVIFWTRRSGSDHRGEERSGKCLHGKTL